MGATEERSKFVKSVWSRDGPFALGSLLPLSAGATALIFYDQLLGVAQCCYAHLDL